MIEPQILSVTEGQTEVVCELRFSNRKSVGICVTPKSEVIVTAPAGSEIAQITRIVKNRMQWINKQLKTFEGVRFSDSVTEYESGQTIQFLGRDYMLKVVTVEEFEDELVVMDHSVLKVNIRDRKQKERINLMIEEWLRTETMIYVGDKFETLSQKVLKYGLTKPRYYLRRMDKRWGSCQPNGVIYLNPELIRLPSHCI